MNAEGPDMKANGKDGRWGEVSVVVVALNLLV